MNKLGAKKARLRLLIVISLAAVVLGGLLLINNRDQSPNLAHPLAAASASKPSTKKIDDYKVAADLPRYIYIPAIHVSKTRIMHLGTDKNYQIISPANVNDAAWYDQSVKPGQIGASFIYGHYYGSFHNLGQLKVGDEIIIEIGNGKKFVYQVVNTKVYPVNKVDMAKVLSPQDPKIPGLSLMTCDGVPVKGTDTLSERLTVFANLKT